MVDSCSRSAEKLDGNGRSPLHLLVYTCHSEDTPAVQYLVDRFPALLQVEDKNGLTPLHIASGVSGNEIVRLLVERCPEILDPQVYAKTPLLAACGTYGDRRCDSPNCNFHDCQECLDEYRELLQILAVSEQAVLAPDVGGCSDPPLHFLSEKGAPPVLLNVILAVCPSSASAKNSFEQIPLHLLVEGCALAERRQEIISYEETSYDILVGSVSYRCSLNGCLWRDTAEPCM